MKRFSQVILSVLTVVGSLGALGDLPVETKKAKALTCPMREIILGFGPTGYKYNMSDLGNGPGVNNKNVPRPDWSTNVDHKGVDIFNHNGAAVFAARDGVLRRGGGTSKVGLGLYVKLWSPNESSPAQAFLYGRLGNNIRKESGIYYPEKIDGQSNWIGNEGSTGENEGKAGTADRHVEISSSDEESPFSAFNSLYQSGHYLHWEVWTPKFFDKVNDAPHPLKPIPYDSNNNLTVDFADPDPLELLKGCENPNWNPARTWAPGQGGTSSATNNNPYPCPNHPAGDPYKINSAEQTNPSSRCIDHIRYYLLKYAEYAPNSRATPNPPGSGSWDCGGTREISPERSVCSDQTKKDSTAVKVFLCRNSGNKSSCESSTSNHFNSTLWGELHAYCYYMNDEINAKLAAGNDDVQAAC